MKKEIVWVYGQSAAGKETFINKIVNDRPEHLLRQFGWQGKKIVASQISINIISNANNDKAEKRAGIQNEVIGLAKQNGVVLIKGQYVDYWPKRQLTMKNALPEYMHKIIYVKVRPEDAAERLIKKSWWNKSKDPIKWANDERLMMEDLIKNLNLDFEIVTINGDTGADYEII